MKISEFIFSAQTLALFRCSCGCSNSVDDLNCDITDKYADAIANAADQKFCSIFDPGRKGWDGNIAEVMVGIPIECEKCHEELELQVLVEFEFYQDDIGKTVAYLNSVIDSVLIDVSNANLEMESGLFQGKNILATLRWLLFRWCVLGEDISIISPFIDRENWLFLERMYSLLDETVPQKCNISKIICRNINYYNKQQVVLEEVLNQLIKERKKICDDRMERGGPECNDPESNCNHKIIEKLVSLVSYRSQWFHAKLYGATVGDKAEVIFTSFNLLTSELSQYENFTMKIMDPNLFKEEINKL